MKTENQKMQNSLLQDVILAQELQINLLKEQNSLLRQRNHSLTQKLDNRNEKSTRLEGDSKAEPNYK